MQYSISQAMYEAKGSFVALLGGVRGAVQFTHRKCYRISLPLSSVPLECDYDVSPGGCLELNIPAGQLGTDRDFGRAYDRLTAPSARCRSM